MDLRVKVPISEKNEQRNKAQPCALQLWEAVWGYGMGWGSTVAERLEKRGDIKKEEVEKDGGKEEETKSEEGLLNRLCSPSLFHHKVDEDHSTACLFCDSFLNK